MNLAGIIFAILSPAAYAVTNYFDKFFLEKYEIKPIVIAIYSGFIALAVSIILILFNGLHIFSFLKTAAIISSGFFIELYLLPYFKALSLEDTSTVVPLMQLYPLFVIIGDAFILKETLSIMQYIGGFLIIFSGLLISSEKVNSYILKPRKAFWYMLFSNLCLAVSTLLFKYGVGDKEFLQVLPYEGFGVFICAILIVLPRKNYSSFRRQTQQLKKSAFFLMFINEGVYITARYFALFALSLISASFVSIFAGIQPLFALIYGVILSLWFPFILKELITRRTFVIKLVSIFVIITGVILLSV